MKQFLNKVNIPGEYLEAVNGNEIPAYILFKRGIKKEELEGFLNWEKYFPTSPWELPNLDKAVDIVKEAVDSGQKICVYGDYDVDGVTSTALLVSVLKMLDADVIYRVPDRFKEGYGLNEEVIKQLPAQGVKLLLTCDCGIANIKEIGLAKELNMQVVVTDHHQLQLELPPADAVVNPQMLPDDHRAKNVPGAAVAYFLARGLLDSYKRADEADKLIDLVALGVIADVVPLRGENRYFVQRGLNQIKIYQKPGITALLEAAGLDAGELTEEDIAFQVAPRLNAAGRIKNADIAVELLLSNDYQEAVEKAQLLNQLNQERQQLCKEMLAEAELMLQGKKEGPIILFQPHWHQGIIGITAGRLCEKYQVPVIMLGLKEDGKTVVGSARSVEGVHIFKVLEQCAEYLDGFGGHAGAAGLSLRRDNLSLFTKVCEKILAEKLAELETKDVIKYDIELPLSMATADLYNQLRFLAPYGEGWPRPTFYCRDVKILSARPTTGKDHLRLVLKYREQTASAMYWWGAGSDIQQGDLLYSISLNRWQGEVKVQLVVNKFIVSTSLQPETERRITIKEVIDRRRWRELGEEPPDFTGAVYYYEGMPLKKFFTRVCDRYSIHKAECLVLLSCPPSSGVLKEMLVLSGAQTLVLAYSKNSGTKPAECVKLVMSYIKYAAKKFGGKISVFELAAITGETELLVMEILRLLRDSGLLEMEIMEQGKMFVKLKPGGNIKEIPSSLKDMIAESNAYRRYMSNVSAEALQKKLNKKVFEF